MGTTIPDPTIERLCKVYTLLERIQNEGRDVISSAEIEKETGIPAHTVRKDISQIGTIKSSKNGYNTEDLLKLIKKTFNLGTRKKACIVGLDILGSAILNYKLAHNTDYEIAAGFDSNINRMEMMNTDVPLFPTYEIPDKVKELSIEFGIIAVAPEKAKETAEKLAEGGIKGIINYSPIILNLNNKIIVKNIYLAEEIRLLSAMIAAADKQKGENNE